MAESFLIKLSLVISIAGLIILFFISEKIRPKEYQINLLSKENLEQLIKIKGTINNVKEIKGLIIMTVEDKSGEIKVILSRKNQILKPEKDQEVEVIGKFKAYQKDFEIEAQEIKIL
ncbi:OB-fold nucleic acid binding domain-containing protein [Candidatus Woesearchaeota archaeon]|nr:OB-fold nucleic acid binding domain-containing protein [Candidatus Woesearchaeota archaeon]